jgi:hypothetical protein
VREIQIIVLAVAVLASVFGVGTWRKSLIAQGDKAGAARVQAAWDAAEAQRNAITTQDNVTRFRSAERTANADQTRQADRARNAAAVDAAAAGLLAETSRLNQRRADPDAASDARLAACTREAATARELFADSAAAYGELAKEADGLRDQVVGLQDFAHDVCGAPGSLTSDDSGGASSSD